MTSAHVINKYRGRDNEQLDGTLSQLLSVVTLNFSKSVKNKSDTVAYWIN